MCVGVVLYAADSDQWEELSVTKVEALDSETSASGGAKAEA